MDDPEAAMMRVLYDEHAAALWRYALRLTGDQARAEVVVQETLLRAWRHPEVTDEVERSARAWLFTVARNLIIDERIRFLRLSRSPRTDDIDRNIRSAVSATERSSAAASSTCHSRIGMPRNISLGRGLYLSAST